MRLEDTFAKQQNLLILQVVLLFTFLCVILVSVSFVYTKATIFDEEKEAKRVKKIDQNDMFQDMYKSYKK
ncbi:MAG: hypothetical protein CSA19_01275 [Deltaproteobacteria bacterium]|nr:MAG: hypothetical protein CSA19_01275 [Deltaproteobacteria bacterium]